MKLIEQVKPNNRVESDAVIRRAEDYGRMLTRCRRGSAPVEGYELREGLCGDCDADSRVFSGSMTLPDMRCNNLPASDNRPASIDSFPSILAVIV